MTPSEFLASLDRFRGGPAPVVTAYLDHRFDAEGKRDRARLFLKNRVKKARLLMEFEPDPTLRAAFERDLDRIGRYLERAVEPDTDGVAIFSSTASDIFEAFQLPHPFDDQLVVSNRPHLRQLTTYLSAHTPVLACQADARRAIFLEVVLGRVRRTKEVPAEAKEPPNPGARDRSDRHRRSPPPQHIRNVAANCARIARKHDFRRIVLLGQPRILADVERHLPADISPRVVGREPLESATSEAEALAVIQAALALALETEEGDLTKRALARGLSRGRGAVGIEPVIEALTRGAVDTLLVAPTLEARGFRDPTTGHLHADEDTVGRQGSPFLEALDLVEGMLFEAYRQGAAVRILSRCRKLEHHGVAALLRYGLA